MPVKLCTGDQIEYGEWLGAAWLRAFGHKLIVDASSHRRFPPHESWVGEKRKSRKIETKMRNRDPSPSALPGELLFLRAVNGFRVH